MNRVSQKQPLERMAFRVREVAPMIGVCEKTVRRMISAGEIRTFRLIRGIRIPKSEVERLTAEAEKAGRI